MQEIEDLKTKSLPELLEMYKELYGEHSSSTNEVFLRRKIAYRIQEQASGTLSRKAKSQIAELIAKYDPVNNKTLRPQVTTAGKELKVLPSMRDKRLPIPGTIIKKNYKGQIIEVRVLEKGFEYNNTYFRTLSAIAQEITGSHWNGFNFFGM